MEIIVAKPPTVGKLWVTGSQKSLHYSIPVDFTRRSCTPSEVPNNSNKGVINPTQAIQRLLWDSKEMFYFCNHYVPNDTIPWITGLYNSVEL